ncbi:pyridoxamine kinase [Clostridium carnis]
MDGIIKKVAAVHDISGIGRCSLTAAIPILSVLGVQCCPYPTAVLSSQTGFEGFSFLDLSNEMEKYKKSWKDLNIKFDCIYSGFLGSEKQIEILKEFIKSQKESLIIIDPVMGDNGILYDTYTYSMCSKIKELVSLAYLVTPNLTEACILTNREYSDKIINIRDLKDIAKDICKLGAKKVIITGIIKDNEIWNVAYDSKENEYNIVKCKYNNKSYSGTGDVFTSIICGLTLKGYSLNYSVKKATDFIYKAIEFSIKYDGNPKEGIMFEGVLRELL